MSITQAPRNLKVEPLTESPRLARSRWIAEVTVFAILISLVAIGFTRSSSHLKPALVSTAAGVTMPGDRFAPAYLSVVAGTTVTWRNTDTDPHTVTSAPGDPVSFSLDAAPGATVSFRFTKPGMYPYYCADHAMWDATTGLPKGMKGTDIYPEAMAGVVIVAAP